MMQIETNQPQPYSPKNVGTINDHFSPSPSLGRRRGRGAGEIEIQTKFFGDRVEVKARPDFQENLQRPPISKVLRSSYLKPCGIHSSVLIYPSLLKRFLLNKMRTNLVQLSK